MCPKAMCLMFCEHGFKQDENGCDMCQCEEVPEPRKFLTDDQAELFKAYCALYEEEPEACDNEPSCDWNKSLARKHGRGCYALPYFPAWPLV
eukprot:TRINITY_DN1122_c0_g1_i1.p1 TRINITY_DN1122_c0_g1~~TRINITY_DN1122_c0_g1_i1.p1  ORF type:complete len:92 (-),score=26.79 TRINITY_DN1122_c0_g1_i1:27-302(-)